MPRTSHLLLPLAVVVLVAAPLRGQDIDHLVNRWLETQHVPGAAIAVVKDGALIKVQGYGLADVENRVPVRPDTVFKIGSLSKQFIAAGILLLVAGGQDCGGRCGGQAPRGFPPGVGRHHGSTSPHAYVRPRA